MNRKKRLLWIAPAAIAGIALFIAIGGGIVMYLWNWLLPMLFGWRLITFWQAVALLALCRILFGGVSGRGWRRSYSGRRMAERWQGMTPEEREGSARACAQAAALARPRAPAQSSRWRQGKCTIYLQCHPDRSEFARANERSGGTCSLPVALDTSRC